MRKTQRGRRPIETKTKGNVYSRIVAHIVLTLIEIFPNILLTFCWFAHSYISDLCYIAGAKETQSESISVRGRTSRHSARDQQTDISPSNVEHSGRKLT